MKWKLQTNICHEHVMFRFYEHECFMNIFISWTDFIELLHKIIAHWIQQCLKELHTVTKWYQLIHNIKIKKKNSIQFRSVQSLSRVWLFVTSWIAAHQAFLYITNSRSLPKPISIESVMPPSHLILCLPLLLLLPILPSIRIFSNESTLHMRWPKYWGFSFSISPSNDHPGLISFRVDWLDLLAVQGTLKSLLKHHSSKVSILQHSAFFTVQLSHPYMTTGKTIALTRRTFVCKVMSLLLNMLSMLVTTFLPRSKRLLISQLQSPSAVILEPRKIKSATVSTVFPSISQEVMGQDAMILAFWMLSFKPTFSLCSFKAKEAFDKISYKCILKTQQTRNQGGLLQLDKA